MAECENQISTEWLQGALLPDDLFGVIKSNDLKDPISPFTHAAIISHSCDIQGDFSKEPFIEILCFTEIEKIDGNFTGGRHERKYHLYASDSNNTVYLETKGVQRIWLPKELLLGHEPSSLKIDPHEIRCLISWIALRYSRPALPDNFNKLWSEVAPDRKLKKFLKNHHDPIHSMFIRVDPNDEELIDEPYEVDFVFAIQPTYGEVEVTPLEKHSFLKDFENEITKTVEKVNGIELSLKFEWLDALPLATIDTHVRYLKYDYLSNTEE